MDTKGEIESDTAIAVGYNMPLTSMDKYSRQKINEKTVTLNDTLDQMNFIDIFRAFHPRTAKCTFFSSAHETFSRIDHMLGHKASLNKLEKFEIISDNSNMKLEINHKKKNLKITETHTGPITSY